MFYAVTRRGGRWVLVTSGLEPQEVYNQAREALLNQEIAPDEEAVGLGPDTESEIDSLRVVPELVARKEYLVNEAYLEEVQEAEEA